MGRGGDRGRGARERAPGARRQEGRRLRDPRADEPRVGALRLRARARRRRRRGDLREQRGEGLRVHPRPLRVGRRARRGRGAAREDRRLPRAQPEARARADVRRPRRPAGSRPRLRPRESGRARARRRIGEPRRRLHLHLHVGYDRPAEGLHDPAPQLLRDGRRRRRDRRLHDGGRHDAPLPAARAQLRPVDAPAGALRRVHARVPRRSAARRRGAQGSPADVVPERAARVREGPHGGGREVRRRDRREAEDRRLGARRRRKASERRAAGKALGPVLGAQHRLADKLVYSKVKAQLGGNFRHRDLGRRAALEGDRRVLPLARRAHSRGVRADRVHDRGDA